MKKSKMEKAVMFGTLAVLALLWLAAPGTSVNDTGDPDGLEEAPETYSRPSTMPVELVN